MFLFLFSTAVPKTNLQWSIPLLFIFNHVFYIHPISHSRVAFCLYVKTSLSTKPFIWLSPTGSLTHFYVKGFAQRLVLKRRQKETFIHELLTGAFDLKTCPVTWIIRFTCFKESATLQDRPRADRFTAFVFHINPYKPHIFWKLSSSRLWLIALKISKS